MRPVVRIINDNEEGKLQLLFPKLIYRKIKN